MSDDHVNNSCHTALLITSAGKMYNVYYNNILYNIIFVFFNSVSWPFNSLPAHDITSHNVCVYIKYV